MCTARALRNGLKSIGANKGPILLIWLTNLILALAVAFPVFGWLTGMNHTTEAEDMLNGFSLPLLFDLLQYDFSTVLRLIGTLAFWSGLCALLLGTFISGGVLSVLVNTAPDPFLERFFAGAGRYFSRFLALLLGTGLCAGIILVGLNVLLGILIAHVSQDASDLTPMLLGLGQLTVTVLVGTAFLLALHYARIHIVEGATDLIRAYWQGMVFVFRNILRVFALIIFFSALAGAVYLAYWGARSALPTTNWSLILLLIAIQQIVVLARSAFQVGLYGAELEFFRMRRPKPPEPVEVVPVAEAPEEVPVVPEAVVSTSEGEPDGSAWTDTN